jgi:xanthine dehydrogenase molybdopterin-binding subunit B
MLSLYPVLSTRAGAVLKVDTTGAYLVSGVVTVLTAEDVPGENDTGTIVHDEPLLPVEEISYWGKPSSGWSLKPKMPRVKAREKSSSNTNRSRLC